MLPCNLDSKQLPLAGKLSQHQAYRHNARLHSKARHGHHLRKVSSAWTVSHSSTDTIPCCQDTSLLAAHVAAVSVPCQKPPQHSHDCAFPVQASFRTDERENSASRNGASLNGAGPSNGRASRLAPDAQVAVDHSSNGASTNGASLNGAGSSQQNGASVAAADLNGAGRDSANMLRGGPKRERELVADRRARAVGQALEEAAAVDAQVGGKACGTRGSANLASQLCQRSLSGLGDTAAA